MSPTQRSLAYLRGAGYYPIVVEKWNGFAGKRQDLFGIFDILAIRPGETLGVQVSTLDGVKERVEKITNSDVTPKLREAGWRIEVHGWRKLKSGWEPKIVDLS